MSFSTPRKAGRNRDRIDSGANVGAKFTPAHFTVEKDRNAPRSKPLTGGNDFPLKPLSLNHDSLFIVDPRSFATESCSTPVASKDIGTPSSVGSMSTPRKRLVRRDSEVDRLASDLPEASLRLLNLARGIEDSVAYFKTRGLTPTFDSVADSVSRAAGVKLSLRTLGQVLTFASDLIQVRPVVKDGTAQLAASSIASLDDQELGKRFSVRVTDNETQIEVHGRLSAEKIEKRILLLKERLIEISAQGQAEVVATDVRKMLKDCVSPLGLDVALLPTPMQAEGEKVEGSRGTDGSESVSGEGRPIEDESRSLKTIPSNVSGVAFLRRAMSEATIERSRDVPQKNQNSSDLEGKSPTSSQFMTPVKTPVRTTEGVLTPAKKIEGAKESPLETKAPQGTKIATTPGSAVRSKSVDAVESLRLRLRQKDADRLAESEVMLGRLSISGFSTPVKRADRMSIVNRDSIGGRESVESAGRMSIVKNDVFFTPIKGSRLSDSGRLSDTAAGRLSDSGDLEHPVTPGNPADSIGMSTPKKTPISETHIGCSDSRLSLLQDVDTRRKALELFDILRHLLSASCRVVSVSRIIEAVTSRAKQRSKDSCYGQSLASPLTPDEVKSVVTRLTELAPNCFILRKKEFGASTPIRNVSTPIRNVLTPIRNASSSSPSEELEWCVHSHCQDAFVHTASATLGECKSHISRSIAEMTIRTKE